MALAPNPARSARRKTELSEKLGSENRVCFYCGCTELVALRRVSRKLLEEHHFLGRNDDPDSTIWLCRNCHALAHENLLDAGVDLQATADPIQRIARTLRAEAVHLEQLARAKRMQAEVLERGKT